MALVTNIPITSATTENLSRNEYLLWVNEALQSEFSKIEQLHTGAGYCLFTEILFPGNIGMKRVKFNSRLELDWLGNWKIVQTSWKNLGIEKVIPVEKLIKGKFQDNFEFLQWFKKFFDANYDGHEYNPMEMRNFEELPKENKLKPGGLLRQPQQLQQKKTTTASTTSQQQRAGSNVSMNSTGGGGSQSIFKKSNGGMNTTTIAAAKKPTATMANSTGRQSIQNQQKAVQPPPQQQSNAASAQQQKQLMEEMKNKDQQIEELRSQLAETDDVVGGLEKERDFYFAKLRKIEVICQEKEVVGTLAVNDVLQILYETEEGFAPPEDADVVVGSNGGGEYVTNETMRMDNGHDEY